jgi:hypothetical protein
MPRELKGQEKMNRTGLSLQHLLQYADEREDMLNRFITGDESWVHYYQLKSKRASMQWTHPSSPSTKKFNVMPSAGRVMLTMFWDSRGVLFAPFQKCGENVNSALYCEILLKLRDAENVEAKWQEGYCFIMTMPGLIQPKQARREF